MPSIKTVKIIWDEATKEVLQCALLKLFFPNIISNPEASLNNFDDDLKDL